MESIQEAVEIISKIEFLGYEAVIVGGAVRDRLIGLSSYDIDIATAMPIEEIKRNFTTYDNGSSYLSITIIYNDNSYEITTFRTDISYTDHRHPRVAYTSSFKEDSKRRDFTINALAYDKDLNVIDYHNGLNDLNNRLIRAIGNPNDRFNEDSLRILRGIYLAGKLDFNIEDNTLAAMISSKDLLASLSEERLYSYFYRIINTKYNKGIEYINKYSLFSSIPIYENWLRVAKKGINKDTLVYLYYLKYKQLPLTNKGYIRDVAALDKLIESSFSNYSLYKYRDYYYKAKEALSLSGYDTVAIDLKIAKLAIKEDNELMVSKELISSFYEGKEISSKIDLVINKILDGEIPNTREAILNLLGRR